MSIIVEQRNILNSISGVKPTAILDQLDLIECELEYHWHSFEQLTLDAQRQLDLYDLALSRRRELSHQANEALIGAEEVAV